MDQNQLIDDNDTIKNDINSEIKLNSVPMNQLWSNNSINSIQSLDSNNSTSNTSPLIDNKDSLPPKKKRKKRQTGVFQCDFPNCGKSFTRAEHLSRHKLNHNPTIIYKCPWENCNKSFVRSDLKDRHLKRHELRKLKEEAKLNNLLTNPKDKGRKKLKNNNFQKINNKFKINNDENVDKMDLNSIILKNPQINNQPSMLKKEFDPIISSPSSNSSSLQTSTNNTISNNHQSNQPSSSSSYLLQNPIKYTTPTNVASPSNLINWLFDENQDQSSSPMLINNNTNNTTNNNNSMITPSNNETPSNLLNMHILTANNFFNHDDIDPFNELSSNIINELLTIPPNYFPNPIQQTSITPEIVSNLLTLIPSIANHEYLSDLSYFLELYWKCFHVQYPILHKPSFNTFTCPSILLLSMIMTGASYATSVPNYPKKYDSLHPRVFADLIAIPLRFIIFQNDDFNPPSPIYIIQSLLLLECYERLSSNRKLHERAYVHHGTTIQLLRRSPGLGGNPLDNKVDYDNNKNLDNINKNNISNSNSNSNTSNNIWEKWIDYEMLKRTALFAFYIDSVHSIVFGYHLILSTHQIQLDLPCDEELWESYLNSNEIPSKSDSIKFLSGLKMILNNEIVKTSRFGKKILLSGLLTIMFQLQQDELQGSILEINKKESNWREKLSLGFDFYNCEILSNCCNSSSALFPHDSSTDDIIDQSLPLTLQSNDYRCKYPVYHMAQITLRIQHYDYYIYSGAPWRMNVKAESTDYELVEKKIIKWSNSNEGAISVIYAYLFMFEMFLLPQDVGNSDDFTDDIDAKYQQYNGNNEAIYNRLNVLALVSILLWSYVYSKFGHEALEYNDDELHVDEYQYINGLNIKENGIKYLKRVRHQLSELIDEKIHLKEAQNFEKFHLKIKKLAKNLHHVKDLQNITGLLKLISINVFKNCYWEVGKEFSRLILNCCKRSLGSKKIRCDDMYKCNY
ncbi:hypothetical protein WICMUC_004777 [Wickerhamomyces mucosus]|uniref:C2H2-type domain-containing protein n=1 Tax=Wickerhamomyces mucosus TaxID=1378264 RepID=A0A9P8T910_9ASCO|nr:hypothetical protein WICMUC_004777 [Wickerhamomyces mucosus]